LEVFLIIGGGFSVLRAREEEEEEKLSEGEMREVERRYKPCRAAAITCTERGDERTPYETTLLSYPPVFCCM